MTSLIARVSTRVSNLFLLMGSILFAGGAAEIVNAQSAGEINGMEY